MAPVHERAAALAVGRDAVELGCCFGFLALRLAAGGRAVTAVDLCPGTAALLGAVAPRLGSPLRALAGDAAAVPLAGWQRRHSVRGAPAGAPAGGAGAGRRRGDGAGGAEAVAVAVPFEREPDRTWGHVRTVDVADLAALGVATGRAFRVGEHHGGWLVIDVDQR